MTNRKTGTDINREILYIKKKKASFWQSLGRKEVFNLFKSVSKNVPAYRKFLKKSRISPQKIKSYNDFLNIPQINKKNYISQYSIEDLTKKGSLSKPLIFTSTSGSTGKSYYFHRSFKIDKNTSIAHELFFLNGNYKKNEPVLVIVCFGMGVWIGGLITYQAFRIMQENSYNLSIITPGINKEEIFRALKSIGPSFKNIILVGYPPFIKDIVDEAPSKGINWQNFKTRIIFAAEPFTEKFRDYIAKKAAVRNVFLDTMNIYGTAELGAMSFETPLSIMIRRICVKDVRLFHHIFGPINKTPTLTQYIPSFINFTSNDGNILVTGDNTIPLVQYALGDRGGVYSFKEVIKHLKELGVDIKREARKTKIGNELYELPFVYVYERDDMSTHFYGLQVYPEPIRDALLRQPVCDYLTGKFSLETKFDARQNQYFTVHLELRNNHGLPNVIKKAVSKLIVDSLENKNSEYRELHKFLGKRALPRLAFWPNGDPNYFKSGTKQKWVKK